MASFSSQKKPKFDIYHPVGFLCVFLYVHIHKTESVSLCIILLHTYLIFFIYFNLLLLYQDPTHNFT